MLQRCVLNQILQVPGTWGLWRAQGQRPQNWYRTAQQWYGCDECVSMCVSEQTGESVHCGFGWLRGGVMGMGVSGRETEEVAEMANF